MESEIGVLSGFHCLTNVHVNEDLSMQSKNNC